MAPVTAELVKELRARTQTTMLNCRKALIETDGDIEQAIKYLEENGIIEGDKRAGQLWAEV